MKSKKNKKTTRKILTETERKRIQTLIAKDKHTYKEIAEKCKVSTPTVGRLARLSKTKTTHTSSTRE
jgi:DNA-binding MurR/RpiR family transcriptional regulator